MLTSDAVAEERCVKDIAYCELLMTNEFVLITGTSYGN